MFDISMTCGAPWNVCDFVRQSNLDRNSLCLLHSTNTHRCISWWVDETVCGQHKIL